MKLKEKKYDNPSSLFLYWVLELWILTVKCIQVGVFGCLSMGYEIEQTTVFNFGYCIYHRTRVLNKLDNIEKLIDWIYCINIIDQRRGKCIGLIISILDVVS